MVWGAISPAQRKLRRDAVVRPVVGAFSTWAAEQKVKLEGRGLVATALGYSLRQEAALRCFLDDGRLRMENNSAERALRPIAVGRKAWMFYGSDDHASAAGNFLSLGASCKLHDRDPEPYLCDVIKALPYSRASATSSSPRSTAPTHARLDPREIERELGPITVPPLPAPPLPAKEKTSTN